MRPGQLLIATPLLRDPNFDRAVVYLFSHEDGAAGVVLNRPTELDVADVLPGWERASASPALVHLGGPVAFEHAVALGTGTHPEMVTPDIGVVDLEGDPDALRPASIRLFAGYAGWADGQLEAEVEESAWFVVDGTPLDVLDPDPTTLWRRVLARQGGRLRSFATYPDDPLLN